MKREIKLRITDGHIPKGQTSPKEKLMNFLLGKDNKSIAEKHDVRRKSNVKDERTVGST